MCLTLNFLEVILKSNKVKDLMKLDVFKCQNDYRKRG